MKIRYSVDGLKRSISSFAGKSRLILVLLRYTPNPSSKFIDVDVEIPCARGTLVEFEPPLYVDYCHIYRFSCDFVFFLHLYSVVKWSAKRNNRGRVSAT